MNRNQSADAQEVYELWQTEWCPASRIDYLTHQVPVEKNDRVLLRERTGSADPSKRFGTLETLAEANARAARSRAERLSG